MRRTVIIALATTLAFAVAAPAWAGTVSTTNACKWSFDRLWRDQAIDLTGTGTPTPVAPGSGVSLTAASIHARLPDWVGEYGANLGVLKPGENSIPVKVWVSMQADGSAQGVQVLPLETVVKATVTDKGDGTYAVTPFDVTIPLPDTLWTAPSAAGAVAWHQAGPGTLGSIPAGPAGSAMSPAGSVLIAVSIGTFTMQLDCQPGTAPRDGQSFTAATAAPFETVPVQAGGTTITPPAVKPPALTLRTTKLKRSGKSVSVSIACADAVCKGTASMTKATKKVSYSLVAGARKTIKFSLSSKTVKALKKKSALVTVKVTTEGGDTVSKKLRLK